MNIAFLSLVAMARTLAATSILTAQASSNQQAAVQQANEAKHIAAATAAQLVGNWETANVDKPFDEDNPKLTLTLSADGSVTEDKDTNRETRGTWRVKNDNIVMKFANATYSHRLVKFDGSEGLLVLRYEKYGNRPLVLRRTN